MNHQVAGAKDPLQKLPLKDITQILFNNSQKGAMGKMLIQKGKGSIDQKVAELFADNNAYGNNGSNNRIIPLKRTGVIGVNTSPLNSQGPSLGKQDVHMTDETITQAAEAAIKRSSNGQVMDKIGPKSLQNSYILMNNQQ